jgi:soluble lytic murein transglycosylase
MKTLFLAASAALALLVPGLGSAQSSADDDVVVQAREALRTRDRARLATLRVSALTVRHPLAQWVEYWELNNRLGEAQADEVEAFYARWPGTYVEDRLRNDWLLELGRRRDWATFARDMPRFRMNDDREVTCYQLLTQHLAGQDVRFAARAAWMAQRDLDDGCNLLATTLYAAGQFKADDAWATARLAAELGRPRVARAAATLISPATGQAVADLFDNPVKFLAKKPTNHELVLLAIMRLAAADPVAAAAQLDGPLHRRLSAPQQALAWAVTARQSAFKLQPEAPEDYRRAWRLVHPGSEPGWSDDVLAWQVRAALRAPPTEPDRWALVQRAIDAMSETEQREPAWVYWKARALIAQATAGPDGEPQRLVGRVMLESIGGQMNFYAKLATEDLGGRVAWPPPPAPLAAAERAAAGATPGFTRALRLIALGLRSEGVREWNFTLRGLGDRELLAAAALACEREIWDRCINTSDRTRTEIDMAQRFPTPFRNEVLAKARETGLDPAYVYGLIRQESRFIVDARSAVGASGLMQIMPNTARWTAKKIGFDYRAEMIADRDVNLRLGANYLKLVLDAFDGSQALAAAAYNAGPNRPRRWREGPAVDAAIWIENIPFNETRDYVKKVLSNAVYYAMLLNGQTPSLKARLGGAIGPRDPNAPNAPNGDREIP